mmetsp:Transcript_62351/g.118354  ORF Transcript_62351/g.118354 Transcript_62351/m.118354 type:complete len:210 (+) Transcript_62351:625-1254(+)
MDVASSIKGVEASDVPGEEKHAEWWVPSLTDLSLNSSSSCITSSCASANALDKSCSPAPRSNISRRLKGPSLAARLGLYLRRQMRRKSRNNPGITDIMNTTCIGRAKAILISFPSLSFTFTCFFPGSSALLRTTSTRQYVCFGLVEKGLHKDCTKSESNLAATSTCIAWTCLAISRLSSLPWPRNSTSTTVARPRIRKKSKCTEPAGKG